MATQKNSVSWDLQLGFNLAFKRLTNLKCKIHVCFALTTAEPNSG